MESRLVWQGLEHALGPADLVAVWRRDAVLGLGGFSSAAIDPHLDLMCRVQTARDSRFGGRCIRGGEIFGRGPSSFAEEIAASGRRRAAVLQCLARCGPDELDALGPPTVGRFMAAELVAPLAQLWIVSGTILGAALGLMDWPIVAAACLTVAFGHGALGAAAVLMRGASPGAPSREETRTLALVAPLEFLCVRPLAAVTSLFYR
jgi:hypothetical protein